MADDNDLDLYPDHEDGEDDLADVEALLRELEPDDLELTAPPPDLWSRIERAAGDLPQARPGAGPSAKVVSLEGRRRQAPYRLLALAAAAVALVVAGAVLVATRDDDPPVIADAVLTYDPVAFDPLGAGASAKAELIERDGHYEIRLTDASLPASLPEAADLELWLIELDADQNPVDVAPVSLVDAAEPGTYRVPDDLDPVTHFVVDISIEPRDGDEQHSGRSILRGPLDFT